MLDKRVEIRLSSLELDLLDSICTDKGVSKSEFVRTMIHESGTVRTVCTDKKKVVRTKTTPGPHFPASENSGPKGGVRTSTGLWIPNK